LEEVEGEGVQKTEIYFWEVESSSQKIIQGKGTEISCQTTQIIQFYDMKV